MKLEIINSIVTLTVGLVALVVYWLSKRAEKRNAATIVVMDIRHAEQVVLSILEKGSIDRALKNILSDNNWAKYKHLFASTLSYDDFSAFNRFFDACVEISDARRRMNDVFVANLVAKSSIIQQNILDIKDLNSTEGQELRNKLISEVNNESFVFEPSEPRDKIFNSLQLMGRLSNTVAFEKLKNIAGINA